MNTQRLIDKLTSWPVTLTVCLLIVLGTLTVKLWPRTVPFDQCSEAYQTYANHPDIQATFIKDYYIYDTVPVDVTLLRAQTDSAWVLLRHEFDIAPTPPEVIELGGEEGIFIRAAHKKDSSLLTDSTESPVNDVVVYSMSERLICIIFTETKQQLDAAFRIIFKESISRNKKES